jgi:hypothetical protein
VHVHPRTYLSFPQELGFDLQAGDAAAIALSEVYINRQNKPYHAMGCGSANSNGGPTSYSNVFSGCVLTLPSTVDQKSGE